MKNKQFITLNFIIISIFIFNKTNAQDSSDLIKNLGIEETTKTEYVKYAFKSPRVINSHSIEFLNEGTLDFRILHRFGLLDQGAKNFFGLDQASMRIGLDYGLKPNLMVGIGRSTFEKEVDGYIKYAPLRQSYGAKNFPITVALATGVTINGMPFTDTSRNNFLSSRFAYYFLAIIGRKFNEKITLQITPTLVHKNLVQLTTDANDIFGLGFGGRAKVSKRTAITWDYTFVLNNNAQGYYNPLSIGLDIETGGHVFQLHFTNANGMNERAFITETTNQWG